LVFRKSVFGLPKITDEKEAKFRSIFSAILGKMGLKFDIDIKDFIMAKDPGSSETNG
jgi:hypothetical protein